MRKITLLLILITALVLVACDQMIIEGSGKVVEESREVLPADVIDVCCGMELYLTQDELPSLRIEAEDNLIGDIVDDHSGSTLTLEYQDSPTKIHRPTIPVKVFVTMPDIQGVTVSGGGRFEAEQIDSQKLAVNLSGGSQGRIDSASATDLTVDVSGGGRFISDNLEADKAKFDLSGGSEAEVDALAAGDVQFSISGGGRLDGQRILATNMEMDLSGGSESLLVQFAGDELETKISGGGRATIAGDVGSQLIELSGGSNFDGPDLRSLRSEVRGNGDAIIWAVESLMVDLSGGSTVEYYGNPTIDSQLSGGSEVKPLGGR